MRQNPILDMRTMLVITQMNPQFVNIINERFATLGV